uniref:Uncharacterized protein n=1 Tax=Setaria italica TaxID=4555 RepID=K3YZA2_SETIT
MVRPNSTIQLVGPPLDCAFRFHGGTCCIILIISPVLWMWFQTLRWRRR